jgi:hypothetical protein
MKWNIYWRRKKTMHDPFVTNELTLAISAMGRELETSYQGVLKEVSDFVGGFRMCDTPFLVAALENATTAMKSRFDKHDDMLYRLVTIPGTTVVISTPHIQELGQDRERLEGADDE